MADAPSSIAPSKIASEKSAPLSTADVRSAPLKSEPETAALLKLARIRLEPMKSTPAEVRSASLKIALSRSIKLKSSIRAGPGRIAEQARMSPKLTLRMRML